MGFVRTSETFPCLDVCAGVARRPGGNVTRAQLTRLGCSSALVGALERRGLADPSAPGRLRRRAPSARRTTSRWWAAVLACGDDAGASHRVAAAAMGLMRAHPRVDVDCAATRKRPGIVTHRADPSSVVYVDGLPCTTSHARSSTSPPASPSACSKGPSEQAQVARAPGFRRDHRRRPRLPATRGIRQLRAILAIPSRSRRREATPSASRCARSSTPAGAGRSSTDLSTGRVSASTSTGPSSAWSSRSTARRTSPAACSGPATPAATRCCARRGWRVVRLPDTEAATAPRRSSMPPPSPDVPHPIEAGLVSPVERNRCLDAGAAVAERNRYVGGGSGARGAR